MNIVSPYTLLVEGMPEHLTVTRLVRGQLWTGAELSDGSAGIAMRSRTATLPRQYDTLTGLSARQAAGALSSWNLEEASDAMAVVNASPGAHNDGPIHTMINAENSHALRLLQFTHAESIDE